MADYYSTMVAKQMVPCTRSNFEELNRALRTERDRLNNLGIEICVRAEYIEGEGALIFAKKYFDDDNLSENVCASIGRLLSQVDQEYLEFGISNFASIVTIGSHGGESFRLYANGSLVWPKIVWPEK